MTWSSGERRALQNKGRGFELSYEAADHNTVATRLARNGAQHRRAIRSGLREHPPVATGEAPLTGRALQGWARGPETLHSDIPNYDFRITPLFFSILPSTPAISNTSIPTPSSIGNLPHSHSKKRESLERKKTILIALRRNNTRKNSNHLNNGGILESEKDD